MNEYRLADRHFVDCSHLVLEDGHCDVMAGCAVSVQRKIGVVEIVALEKRDVQEHEVVGRRWLSVEELVEWKHTMDMHHFACYYMKMSSRGEAKVDTRLDAHFDEANAVSFGAAGIVHRKLEPKWDQLGASGGHLVG